MKQIVLRSCFCFLAGMATAWAEGGQTPPPVHRDAQTTQEALDEAQELFLDAMDALKRAGKLAYEKNAPEMRGKAEKTLEESKKILEQWMERVKKEMESPKHTPQDKPSEPKKEKQSYI
ncbi:MAG: hypothetical protein HQL79_11915 [Magnetococcales bacterium]|nr:hypothetical protein [Magnetococcales bacterium]